MLLQGAHTGVIGLIGALHGIECLNALLYDGLLIFVLGFWLFSNLVIVNWHVGLCVERFCLQVRKSGGGLSQGLN